MVDSVDALEQGDIIVLDVAVFHRAGVDGACHIEQGLDYVIMDDPDEGPACCVLTVEQENALDNSIAGNVFALTIDLRNGVEGVESNRAVYELNTFRRG